MELALATVTTTTDIANATPGNANVTVNYQVEAVITNTTANRNAPSPAYVVVEPFWPADSPVCAISGQLIGAAFATNVDGLGERWCTVGLNPVTLTPATRDISMSATITASAMYRGSSAYVIPEDQAAAVAATFEAPMWAIGRNKGEGVLMDCLMMSGSYYVTQATTDTGCTAGE